MHTRAHAHMHQSLALTDFWPHIGGMVCLLLSYKARIYLVSRLSRMPVSRGGIIYNTRQVVSSATLSCTLEADKMVVSFPLSSLQGSLGRNGPVPSLHCSFPLGFWEKHQEVFHGYWLETLDWHENPSQRPGSLSKSKLDSQWEFSWSYK